MFAFTQDSVSAAVESEINKGKVFANVSLTRNTVAERISDISTNLDSQLKNKVKSFVTFSVVVDESTDSSDIAQLAISGASLAVFPRIWVCFFEIARFFKTCGLLVFGLVLTEI